ncbi:hypothetical protein TrRE_jg5624, partial [Triparma retinervis]
WWRSKLEELGKVPLSTSEVWKAKNEARLRAIDKVREQFNGEEAPSTLESLLGSSYKPQEVNGTIFRSQIGGSPGKSRIRARNQGKISDLKSMTGVYDWSADDRVINHVPTPSKAYANKDLERSIRQREEHEQEERDELFFGEFGVFKGTKKDSVSNIVTQLFKSQTDLPDLRKTKQQEERAKREGEKGLEGSAVPEITTPREVVDSKELLTEKFSTLEHLETMLKTKAFIEGIDTPAMSAFSDLQDMGGEMILRSYDNMIKKDGDGDGGGGAPQVEDDDEDEDEGVEGEEKGGFDSAADASDSEEEEGSLGHSTSSVDPPPSPDGTPSPIRRMRKKRIPNPLQDTSSSEEDSPVRRPLTAPVRRPEPDKVTTRIPSMPSFLTEESSRAEFSARLKASLSGSVLHPLDPGSPSAWLFSHEMLARRMPLTDDIDRSLTV